jgi:hypothetical protein
VAGRLKKTMNIIVKLNKNGLAFDTEYQAARWLDFVSKHQGYVRIEPIKGGRSLKANSYYWICLEAIGAYCGYSADELHRLFKGLYLPKKTMKYRGKDYQMSGSTAELSTSEFQEYMEKISVEASQLGVILPDANAYKKFIDSAPMKNEN